jgi:excisionase family DNA binding protein
MPDLMTLEEIALYLRVSEKTVYRLINEGNIPVSKVGRLYRFNKTLVDNWLQEKPTENKISVIVIDDDESICGLFKDTLEGEGFDCTAVNDPFQGLEMVKNNSYDMVFLDLKMPGMDGAELLRQIRQVKPQIPVNVITGFRDSELMTKALVYGPMGVIGKPFTSSEIITAVHSYIRIPTDR